MKLLLLARIVLTHIPQALPACKPSRDRFPDDSSDLDCPQFRRSPMRRKPALKAHARSCAVLFVATIMILSVPAALLRAQTSATPVAYSDAKQDVVAGMNLQYPLFFTATTWGSGGINPNSIAVGDLNGDGKLDAVVANACNGTSGAYCNSLRGEVGVLLGNGDGTFKPAVIYDSGGTTAGALILADVNGD